MYRDLRDHCGTVCIINPAAQEAFVPAGVLGHEQHCALSESNGAKPDEEAAEILSSHGCDASMSAF